jgi:hypothetical protein
MILPQKQKQKKECSVPFILNFFLKSGSVNSGPTPSATPPALFCDGFFEIECHELFACADFEL